MNGNDRARNDRDDDFERRARPRSSGSSGMGIVFVIIGVVLLLILLCGGGLVGALWFSVGKVRTAAQRMQETNSLKQIGLALHNYHDTHMQLPPAAIKTKDGKPGLSWRVAILPYIEHDYLYKQFKLDEPWDSANNIALLNQMPAIFRSMDDPLGTMTHYRVFVGKGTAFEPGAKVRLGEFRDGTAYTLLVVETTDAVPWTKPDEIDYTAGGALPALGMPGKDYVMVIMADSSVRMVNKKCGPQSWHAAIVRDDNKLPGADFAP